MKLYKFRLNVVGDTFIKKIDFARPDRRSLQSLVLEFAKSKYLKKIII